VGSIINNGTTTGTTTISGVIGSAVTGITENSSTSTLILSGANTTYAGTTTLTLGTLQGLNSGITNVLQAFGTGQLNLNGGTLQLRANGSGIGVTITASNNVVVGGTTTINVDRNSTSPTANTGNTFSMGTLSIGAFTLNVTGANSYALQFGATTLTGNATFNPTTANLTLGALNDGGIARTITKAGSGTLTIGTNATSLVDGTAVGITGGILNSNAASSLGSFANVTISTGATFAIGASQTIGALNSSGTGSVTLGANALTIGNTNNLNSNFAGVISETGGSIVKNGTGSLTLSGANLFTGGVTINAGTLTAGSTTALGPAANATLTFGASSTGKFQLNGFSTTIIDLTTNATVGTPIIEDGAAGAATLT
jgi:autotransporter-associated beta strand protein